MTLHIILPGRDDTLVWIADQKAVLSSNTVAYVEKVLYLKERQVALSTWGDKALLIRDDFGKLVLNREIDLSHPDKTQASLRHFAEKLFGPPPHVEPPPFRLDQARTLNPPRGLALVTFFESVPHLYLLTIDWPPSAPETTAPLAFVGDSGSTAKLFVDYYYPLTQKSPEELVALGIHAMNLAIKLQAGLLGGISAWVFENGNFRKLGSTEIDQYMSLSKSLDAAVMSKLSSGEMKE